MDIVLRYAWYATFRPDSLSYNTGYRLFCIYLEVHVQKCRGIFDCQVCKSPWTPLGAMPPDPCHPPMPISVFAPAYINI